jgi:hypothetical protein
MDMFEYKPAPLTNREYLINDTAPGTEQSDIVKKCFDQIFIQGVVDDKKYK